MMLKYSSLLQMKWENKDPVLFRLYNTHYGNKYIDEYFCGDIHPDSGFSVEFNKSCPSFKELQIKATKAMQPVQSESHQCVL